jgi:hypothetical protein
MNTSPNWLLGAAAMAAFALVDASATESTTSERTAPTARAETTVLEDLAAGMRELLRTATPVITLPAIEIVLPTLSTEQS